MKQMLLIPLLLVTVLFSSCSSSDFDETYPVSYKLEDLKSRIYDIATDYGITNFTINDSILERNINMSDEEIENIFRTASKMNGTFYSTKVNEERNYFVCTKSNQRKRTMDPSMESGVVYGESYGKVDSLDVRYEVSIDFNWSTTEHCYARLDGFSIKKHVESPVHSGNYTWEDLGSYQTQQGVASFSGFDICFEYDFIIVINFEGINIHKDVQCDYSNGILEVNVQDL